jgi:hypothetical protein
MTEKEIEQVKKQYSKYIEETTIDQIKEMCKQGQLNIDSDISKIWAVDYLIQDTSECVLKDFIEQLTIDEVIRLVTIDAELLFEHVYSVKNYMGTDNIIVVFKDDVFNMDSLKSEYGSIWDYHSLKEYLQRCDDNPDEFVQEKYDPLNEVEEHQKLQEIEDQIANGSTTILEGFKDYDIGIDKDATAQIAQDLIDEKLTNADIKKMVDDGELEPIQILLIENYLNTKAPELLEKLSKDF